MSHITFSRSLLVGLIDGGYLCHFNNDITFKLNDYLNFGRGEDYHISENRLQVVSDESDLIEVDHNGMVEACYHEQSKLDLRNVTLIVQLYFRDGICYKRKLISSSLPS